MVMQQFGWHNILLNNLFNALTLHMGEEQKNNPLHGITLEKIVTDLQCHYGWEKLGSLIRIDCFNNNQSIKSSLKFLRRMPWARKKVEDLYLETVFKPNK